MEELFSFSALVALTVGLTEVIKRIGTPDKLIPLVAVAVGLILVVIANFTALTTLSVLTGIAVGLSAVGLYSGVKNTIK
jgi:hypothetical protein